MTAGIENFVQTVTLQPLAIDGMSLELALQGDTSAFNLPIDGCSYLLLMERESVAGGGCRPKFVEIIKYDGYEDDGVTLKITERGVGDTDARAWPIGAVVQQPFLKEHWQAIFEEIGLVAVNSFMSSLRNYAELLRQDKQFSKFVTDHAKDQAAWQKSVYGSIETQKQRINELAMLTAWQAEAEANYKRCTGQSGVLSVRQYTYHGPFSRIFTENGQPGHNHQHPQYKHLMGSGEVKVVMNGWQVGTRHRDWVPNCPAPVGSAFGATEYISPPAQPYQLTVGTPEEKTEALRDLFRRYQAGEMPEGFGWTLGALEAFFVPFTDVVSEYYNSPRHAQEVTSLNAALRQIVRYASGGARNLDENEAFEMPICRVIDADGNAVIGVLKHRMTAVDVSELGDLRPYLEPVIDPIRQEGFGSNSNRFLVKENLNAPGMLDKMMELLPGLEGAGADLVERYHAGDRATYQIYHYSEPRYANAAYYSRFVRTLDDDASGRVVLQRGFNDPYLFTAMTTHENVLNTPIDGVDYRFSYALPMALCLRTPIEEFNPYDIPIADYEELGAGRAGNGTQSNPFHGRNDSIYHYMLPESFFSGSSLADAADTVSASGVWMLGGDGQAHQVRESGNWVNFPKIPGVDGVVRQRYSIFPDHHDGSKGVQTALAMNQQHDVHLINDLSSRLVMAGRLQVLEKAVGL